MALTKNKKSEVIAEVCNLLESSKLTVVATYQGTSVQSMQALRHQARDNGTKVKVVKNRLMVKALQTNQLTKGTDTSALRGMLLYAFNSEDDVAAAQALASFAKTQPTIQFVGAISPEGVFMSSEDVTTLANLPNKNQLRGMLVGTIAAPLSGFVNVMSGNIRGVLNVLNARAQKI